MTYHIDVERANRDNWLERDSGLRVPRSGMYSDIDRINRVNGSQRALERPKRGYEL